MNFKSIRLQMASFTRLAVIKMCEVVNNKKRFQVIQSELNGEKLVERHFDEVRTRYSLVKGERIVWIVYTSAADLRRQSSDPLYTLLFRV